MILFKLTSAFLPGDTLKKYDTINWRERYQDAGDFQIIVENDISILTLLPVGSLISHTDTNEVMIVENHQVGRDNNDKLKTTISGRSFEAFTENRVTERSVFPIYDPSTLVKDPDATYTNPAETVAETILKKAVQSGFAATDDVLANVHVGSVIRVLDTSMTHQIKRGKVYNEVLRLLRLSDAGVHNVRPNGAQTSLDIVVHDGADRTVTVVFYAQAGDLVSPQYLWSIKNYNNYAATATHTAYRLYQDRTLAAPLTGLDRRTLYVEDDDILGNYTSPTSTDAVATEAQTSLNEHQKVSLLSASVATTAKPKFKIHYDVGDLVTVYGEFGLAQPMRVTEHILTVDKDGSRGYPSLSAL